jgi:hypothetical protein
VVQRVRRPRQAPQQVVLPGRLAAAGVGHLEPAVRCVVGVTCDRAAPSLGIETAPLGSNAVVIPRSASSVAAVPSKLHSCQSLGNL